MSSKRIQKRLEKIFTDIKQVEQTSPGQELVVQVAPPVLPVQPTEKAAGPRTRSKPKPRRARSELDTKPLGPEPQMLAQVDTSAPTAKLSMPFRTGPENWEVLEIGSPTEEHLWGKEEQILVKQVTDQLSLAMENARLFQQTRQQAGELQVLNEMGRELSAQLDISGVVEIAFKFTTRLMDTTNFLIAFYTPESKHVDFPIALIDGQRVVIPEREEGNGLIDHLIRTQKPLLVPEEAEEYAQTLKLDAPLVGEGRPASCWMGAPILLGQNLLGVISLQSDTTPHLYNDHLLELLTAIASQLAIAIQNARLFQQTQIRAEELAVLNEMGSALAASLEIQGIVENIYRYASRLLDTSSFYIALHDAARNELNIPLAYREGSQLNLPPIQFGNGPIEHVLNKREPLLIEDNSSEKMGGLGIEVSGPMSKCWLGIPMMTGNRAIGVISIENYTQPFAFDLHTKNILTSIASQAAIAIQNAYSFQETKTRNEELATLNEIIGSASQSLELKNIFEIVLTKTLETIGFDGGLITMFNEARGKLERVVQIGMPGGIPEDPAEGLEKSLCAVVYNSKDTLFISDFRQGAPIDVEGQIKAGYLAYVGAPLEAKGRVLGTICCFRKAAGTINPSSIDLMRSIGRQIGFSIENAHLFDQIRRTNEYLSTSAEIGRLVTSTLDLATLFTRTVNLICERFGFYYAGIFTVDDTGFKAVLKSATGEAGAEMLRRNHALPVGSRSIVGAVTASLAGGSRSIVGTVTATGEPVVVNNTVDNPIHLPNPLLPDTRAEAAIPLKIGNRIIGAIDIQSIHVDAFTQDAINVLQALTDQIAVAIDNARSYELAQQAITEMRELDRLKSQFLANMSHELRTPLNSIIGFSRVILKGIDGPISELQEQDLNAIYNSGQHLLRLINDILDLSKIDAGKMELAFDDVNMVDLLQSVIPTVSGLIKDKPIELIQNISPDIPVIRADSMRIRQVVINLLSNAAKFTEEGSITVDAYVQTNSENKPEVIVKVTDTGSGISLEDQKKLFQPFSQVDASPTRKTGGTGLGLSISRRLIELHGGRIDLYSEAGKGSTFYFTLPLPKIQESQSRLEGQRGDKIILAIDDDPKVISLYERYLQPQGYQVVALTDPTQVLERVGQLKPYAITLDIMMPGRDGWTILQELKNTPGTREIPVIVCTILEDEEKGFSLGATDYLIKPILEDDLLKALNRLNGDGNIHDVLVIDDDPKDLRLIEKYLSNKDCYHPILANSGREGWEKLSQNPPHAVILDLFMPDMDGFAILEKLRTTSELNDIPVLVVSGVDLSPEQQKQLAEFGQKLLQKGSLNENDLLAQLDRALKRINQS